VRGEPHAAASSGTIAPPAAPHRTRSWQLAVRDAQNWQQWIRILQAQRCTHGVPALRDLAQAGRASLLRMAGRHFLLQRNFSASDATLMPAPVGALRQAPSTAAEERRARCPALQRRSGGAGAGRRAARLPDEVADICDVHANLEAAARQRARVQRIVHIRAACRPQRRHGRTRLEVTLSLT